MVKELLPIGSVVLLKGGIKKLVVIGIKQTESENPEEEYDYLGILYPEGYLGADMMFLFNHSDINDIIFKGYHNPERELFLDKIDELYRKQRKMI